MELTDLRNLIDAAGARDPDATVERIGPDVVARALVTELIDRADLPAAAVSRVTTIQLELQFGTELVPYFVRVSPEGCEHGDGKADADVTVSQDLVDLVRGVFGLRGTRTNPTRAITWHDQSPISRWSEVPQVAPLVRRLLRGSAEQPVDLAELLLAMGSDKWGLHFYAEHYTRYFQPFRDRPVVLLELGIGGFENAGVGGGSLHAWSRYFHRGLVCGIDVADKSGIERQRVLALRGDQADTAFIESVVARIGAPDIVLDDGSHRSADVIASFRALFPHLRPGGLYVVEDLQTSYWPRFGGSSTDLASPLTSMGFLKQLADGINYEEISASSGRQPADTDRQVVGLHFHHNLAVVEKGRNEEGTLPQWHPARAD